MRERINRHTVLFIATSAIAALFLTYFANMFVLVQKDAFSLSALLGGIVSFLFLFFIGAVFIVLMCIVGAKVIRNTWANSTTDTSKFVMWAIFTYGLMWIANKLAELSLTVILP